MEILIKACGAAAIRATGNIFAAPLSYKQKQNNEKEQNKGALKHHTSRHHHPLVELSWYLNHDGPQNLVCNYELWYYLYIDESVEDESAEAG